jgi:hypothetical protein
MILIKSMQRAIRLSGVLALALLALSAFGQIPETHAASRIALVGSGGNDGSLKVLDLTTVLLSKDAVLQLLDRAEVDRVLREQALSLAGMVRAEDVVKAGQLLHVDLFAVLEGSLTNESQASVSLGLVVFDAKTGVRYADSALLASNSISAASALAAAVRAAAVKSHMTSQDLHTVGLLSVRNADLPRQFDSICDSVGLLLERELTASPGIAVLERRRLEQVNKERSVAPDKEGNGLLSSLRIMSLDIGRDGEGMRATLTFAGEHDAQTNKITASVPTRNPAALAHLLADKTGQFLRVPTAGALTDREAEAARFHREYVLLLAHHDYFSALHVLDAALALSPEQKDWQREMASLLPNTAVELVDPGGQNWQRSLKSQPTPENLASCLALGQRGADLLLDLSRTAAAQAKPGESIPDVLKNSNNNPLIQLLRKLADVKTADPASVAEIATLAGKGRSWLTDVIEPFLAKQSSDQAKFADYCQTVRLWFWPPSSLNQKDAVLALGRWIEMSHKLNPPDGSGNYSPMSDFLFISHFGGDQIAEFLKSLDQDQDPVIRIYARAGRVLLTMHPSGNSTDKTLEAEREFRLYAQDLLAHDEVAKSSAVRNQVWDLITKMFQYYILNHSECGNESLDACRFAFAQGDIQPNLFYRAAEALDRPRNRNLTGELEVVDGALKLILGKPEAYPKIKGSYSERSIVIKDLQQKRDLLIAELAGTNAVPNGPASLPWNQNACLLDLSKPTNGFGWLFKPLIQGGQVFTVAIGFQEWGLPEDSLQLMRVPLAGGSPTFLGRAKINGLVIDERKFHLAQRLARETSHMAASYLFVRDACIGEGCYFAATCSGVYIFPTNGGPGLQLSTTNGLPSDDIYTVAFLDGILYIGAGEFDRGGYIASYDPATRKVTVLASSRRSEHISPFDDQPPFFTLGLVADSIRHRLIMAITPKTPPSRTNSPAITPSMGIWSYLPATSEYKRLAPLLMPDYDPSAWRSDTWFGLVDANTVAVKELYMMALFDLRYDHIISSYDSWQARTNAAMRFWTSPVLGFPGNRTLANGPFFLRNGWFYSARPFERMAMADGRREQLPPLRTDYPFQPKESLQLLDDGIHVLAADQISLWLLDLKPEPVKASTDSGDNSSSPNK